MTQPTKWSAPLGSGADVQDLPDDDLRFASFSKIFPQITQVPLSAGGVAPRRIDFNSLFKLLADNIYYYQNGGVFEYSDTSDYEKGSLVRYNDKIYLCIQDNSALNTHNPEDINYWLRVALNNELSDYLPLAGGNITGNLTVQNKNVVRSVNDVNADASGNVTLSDTTPVGSIFAFAGKNIPNGYLLCNGAEIDKVAFAKLYAVIADLYGTATDMEKFKLPNLASRYIQGVGTNALGTYLSDGLPNITGSLADNYVGKGVSVSGAFTATWQGEMVGYGSTGGYSVLYLNANKSNSIYGKSSYVTPRTLVLNYIIKY